MGEKPREAGATEPNLELPSFFGRRGRRSGGRRAAEPAEAAEPPEPTESGSVTTEQVEPVENGPATTEQAGAEPAESGGPGNEETGGPGITPRAVPAEPEARVQAPTASPVPERTEVSAPATPGRGRRGGRRAARRARPTARIVPVPVALLATGLLVGLFGAGTTYGGLLGCDAVRGTKSCGGGPGLLLLVAIFALMVLLGAGLLAALRVPDARSTSVLGVGITAVVALVVLMSALFSAWMLVATPLISAAAFWLAWWVSTRRVELPERGPERDVR